MRSALLALLLLRAVSADAIEPSPALGPGAVFAGGLAGPEGLAFTRDGGLIVGSTTGEIRRLGPDGHATVLANLGEALAGITVLRDGRVLAASFASGGRVWMVDRDGAASVLASGIPGANFVVETREGRILASASLAGTIVDITAGIPLQVAAGLGFPNGLAIGSGRALGKARFLYVAETFANRISRLPMGAGGSLGPAEVYAIGLPLADGTAFDRQGNLLVAGAGKLFAVVARTREVIQLAADPPLDGPSNLAFGRGRGFQRRDLYIANFGPQLGNGTTIVRARYSQPGAPLVR